MSLLPPSAFQRNDGSLGNTNIGSTFSQAEQRQHFSPRKAFLVTDSPKKESQLFESALQNQATLIEELKNKISSYELQIISLQQNLSKRDLDLEAIARECEQSLDNLNKEHSSSMMKIERELEQSRNLLENQSSLRLAAEEKMHSAEEKHRAEIFQLQSTLDKKLVELKEAKDESAKLRLYFTGGRDLLSTPLPTVPKPSKFRSVDSYISESETVANLRLQVEALQHIIDVQEEQLRTSKPDVIPGLTTLEKWRRKVYETMVRSKLNELTVGKDMAKMKQEVSSIKEQLRISEAKLSAKDLELKEVKSRLEVKQKLIAKTSENDSKYRECIHLVTQGVAQLGVSFKETASKSIYQLANMERRLELATKRIKQIGANQRSISKLEQLLSERNSEKLASDMQLAIANDTVEDLKRQLSVCQHQLSSASKQKASALDNFEADRSAEREATAAQIRRLTSELNDLRSENAKLMLHQASMTRKLEESGSDSRQSFEKLTQQLKEAKQDYEALAKIAREHGIIDKIQARRVYSPVGSVSSVTPLTSSLVRAQVESLYKSIIQ